MKNLIVLLFLSLFFINNPIFSNTLEFDGGTIMVIEPKTAGADLIFNFSKKQRSHLSIIIEDKTTQKVVLQAETKNNRVFVPLKSGKYLVTVVHSQGVIQEELSF